MANRVPQRLRLTLVPQGALQDIKKKRYKQRLVTIHSSGFHWGSWTLSAVDSGAALLCRLSAASAKIGVLNTLRGG